MRINFDSFKAIRSGTQFQPTINSFPQCVQWRRIEQHPDDSNGQLMIYHLTVAEMMERFPTQFTINPELSEPEKSLFNLLNRESERMIAKHVHDKTHDGTPEAITLLAREQSLRIINTILGNMATNYFYNAIQDELANEMDELFIANGGDFSKFNTFTQEFTQLQTNMIPALYSGRNFEYQIVVPNIRQEIAKLSPPSYEIAKKVLDTVEDDMQRYNNIISQIGTGSAGILDILSLNNLNHKKRIFNDEKDIEAFRKIFTSYLHYIPQTIAFHTDTEIESYDSNQISKGVDAIIKRICAYEKNLPNVAEQLSTPVSGIKIFSGDSKFADEISSLLSPSSSKNFLIDNPLTVTDRKLLRDAKKQNQTDELQEKEAELLRARQEREAAFYAVEQPYSFTSTGKALVDFLTNATLSQNIDIQKRIEGFHAVVQRVAKSVDRRDPGVATLSSLLLSPENLATAAGVLELNRDLAGKCKTIGITPLQASSDTVQQLSALYNGSKNKEKPEDLDTARDVIDRLLKDPEGIILLATLTSTATKAGTYAKKAVLYQSQVKAVSDAENAMADMLGEPFSDEYLGMFADTKEAKAVKDARKNVSVLKTDCSQLEDYIRQTIGGRKFEEGKSRRVRSSAPLGSVTLAEFAPGQQDALRLSPKWKEELGTKYHIEPNGASTDTIRIVSDKVPVSVVTSSNYSSKSCRDSIKKLQSEEWFYSENQKNIEELGQNGFTFKPGSSTELEHPQYGITVSFKGSEADKFEPLLAAKEQLEEKNLEQESLLGILRELGMKVTEFKKGGLKYTTITDESRNIHLVVGQGGYLVESEFAQLNEICDALVKTGEHDLLATSATTSSILSEEYVPWHQDPKQTMIIIDANIIFSLAAERYDSKGKSNGTWADVIERMANLPNVTIVIPDRVVWECTGKMPNEDGEGFSSLDIKREDDPVSRAINHLLEGASRSQIKNGEVSVRYSSNPKIMTMATQGDKAWYEDVRKAYDKGELSSMYGQGAGERAIDEIINELHMPSAIIGNDINYYNDAKKRFTNPHDMPISWASCSDLLVATASYLKPMLHDEFAGYQKIAIEVHRKIDTFWKQNGKTNAVWLSNNVRGEWGNSAEFKNMPEGQTLHEIIIEGRRQQREQHRLPNLGTAAPEKPKDWSEKKSPWSPPSPPRSLDPASVLKRDEEGKGYSIH